MVDQSNAPCDGKQVDQEWMFLPMKEPVTKSQRASMSINRGFIPAYMQPTVGLFFFSFLGQKENL